MSLLAALRPIRVASTKEYGLPSIADYLANLDFVKTYFLIVGQLSSER